MPLDRLIIAFGLTAIVLAFAGHSHDHPRWAWANKDESQLAGTVEGISPRPHGRVVHVDLRNSEGLWDVALSPPAAGDLHAITGESVLLTGHRASDERDRRFEAATLEVGGKIYTVDPGKKPSKNG